MIKEKKENKNKMNIFLFQSDEESIEIFMDVTIDITT